MADLKSKIQNLILKICVHCFKVDSRKPVFFATFRKKTIDKKWEKTV